MGYTLHGMCGQDEHWDIYNPSPEDIDKAIDELIPVKFFFVILENDEPIQNCAYIQTLITDDSTLDLRYLLEVRFVYESHFLHYQTVTTNADDLKKTFRMFALGVIPNVEGWTDITANLQKKDGAEGANA